MVKPLVLKAIWLWDEFHHRLQWQIVDQLVATPLQDNGVINTSNNTSPPPWGQTATQWAITLSNSFLQLYTSWLMSCAHTYPSLAQKSNRSACRWPRVHPASQLMCMHRYTVHTVRAQYRGKDTLTHTRRIWKETHTRRHIHTPPAQKPNQTSKVRTQRDFSEKFVNRFQGTMVCFLLVCHGFTHNSLVYWWGGGGSFKPDDTQRLWMLTRRRPPTQKMPRLLLLSKTQGLSLHRSCHQSSQPSPSPSD